MDEAHKSNGIHAVIPTSWVPQLRIFMPALKANNPVSIAVVLVLPKGCTGDVLQAKDVTDVWANRDTIVVTIIRLTLLPTPRRFPLQRSSPLGEL